MNVALGPMRVQLQVTFAPPQTGTSITDARERAERQLAAHSALVEHAYNQERLRRSIENDRLRWECSRHYP
jgi:hypothetical protein